MSAPVAIFAIGNRGRGDDAAAPLLLDRLRSWLEGEGMSADFDLFEVYQLQLENALDMEGRGLVLFIDAERDAAAPVSFAAVAPASALAGMSTHALSPGAVLGVYRQFSGVEPPPAFVLGLRGVNFDLGAPVSTSTRAAMEEGWEWLRALCRCPRAEEWQTMTASACVVQAQPA